MSNQPASVAHELQFNTLDSSSYTKYRNLSVNELTPTQLRHDSLTKQERGSSRDDKTRWGDDSTKIRQEDDSKLRKEIAKLR